MPYMSNKEYEKLTKEQRTTTGLTALAGVIEKSEYDTLDYSTLMADYTEMMNGDCIASTSLDMLKMPIINSGYEFEKAEKQTDKSKKIEEYLYWIFENMLFGYQYFKRHALLSLDFGHIIFEKVWKRGDDWKGQKTNRLLYCSPIQYQNIHEFLYSSQGLFEGLNYRRVDPKTAKTEYFDIWSDDLYYFTNQMTFNDVRGLSVLRPARVPYLLKKKIMIADARASERGAGLINIIAKTNLTSTEKAQLETVGRTVGNNPSGYVLSQEDRWSIDYKALQNQENNIEKMRYYDSQMFYNTFAQFMESGIGQNGSRSATSEHKTSYDLKLNQITADYDYSVNELCKQILLNSPWGLPEADEMPKFKTSSLKSIDIQSTVSSIIGLINAGAVAISKDDEAFLRSVLGMPEININAKKEIEPKKAEMSHNHNHKIELSDTPIIADPKFNFELANAKMTIVETERKARALIEKYFSMSLKEYAKEFAKYKKGDKTPKMKYRQELKDELKKIYDEGFDEGIKDLNKEYAKAQKTQLSYDVRLKSDTQAISVMVDAIFDATETAINVDMMNQSKENIKAMGGVENYINYQHIDDNKGLKTRAVSVVESSYIRGRLEAILNTGKKGDQWRYTAILDENTCENCAPLDGISATIDEWRQQGLNIDDGQALNPNCLGGVNCHCQLYPEINE